MAKKASKKDYFGLPRIVSLILAILPTAYILGFITRFAEGKIVAGLIRLIGFGVILWIVDAVLMVMRGRILRLLSI